MFAPPPKPRLPGRGLIECRLAIRVAFRVNAMAPLAARLILVGLIALTFPCQSRAMQPDGPRLFTDLDANSDGVLAASEVGSEHRVVFKRLLRTGDANQDGQLTAE